MKQTDVHNDDTLTLKNDAEDHRDVGALRLLRRHRRSHELGHTEAAASVERLPRLSEAASRP